MSHKYNAKPTQVDGHNFDSKREAARYQELTLLQRAGEICNLQLHPTFELQKSFKDSTGKKHRAIVYEADFSYYEKGNPRPIVEDTKGFETQAWLIKKKMFLFHYPLYDLRVVR